VAIVAGVIALAKNFDMTCIAEGIETESQRAYLEERGVLGQGYLLGRPADASVIGRIIADGGTTLRLVAAR
jgi:EAL domain-containing protein (putative c-di-GMP-specific phosphodiesterase class I)